MQDDLELAEFPHHNCRAGLNGSSSCAHGDSVNEVDDAAVGNQDMELHSPRHFGTLRNETLTDECPTSQIAATLSECFVNHTKSVCGKSKVQRERNLQSFRHGWRSRRTWLPALPLRVHVQRMIASIPWFCLQLTAVIADIAFLWLRYPYPKDCNTLWLATLLGVFFALDVALRIYGLGVSVFWAKWRHRVEVTLVVLTFGWTTIVGLNCHKKANLTYFRKVWYVRSLCCLLVTLMYRTGPFVRRITSENKRRFISSVREFDLDLTYITPRLVGMSVPAGGCITSVYRNPLREVVRFFETFHAHKYMIINACPELPYPTSGFTTGVIEHFEVEDHMPAQLAQIVKFLRLGRAWSEIEKDHLLAVHCRGGKGRTGVFCCAWLLYTKEAEDAQDAVNYFSVQRTDLHSRLQSKVQTVETPSQMRYVGYIEQMLRQQDCFFPAQILQPPPVLLKLHSVTARGMFRTPAPDHLRASVLAMRGRRQLYTSPLGTDHWRLGGVVVEGDVRVSICKCPIAALEPGGRGPRAKRGEDVSAKARGKAVDSLFHFVFHTAFVGECLQLEVPFIDKACKNKKLYNSSGLVELSFSRV